MCLIGRPRKESKCIWFILSTLVLIAGCHSPSHKWDGIWRLNLSKSVFHTPTITISVAARGEYSYTEGSVSKTFRCDGRYRPIGNNRTQACLQRSPNSLDRIRMEHGVKTNTYHWELSDRGKVFTATATGFNPDGSISTSQLIASRVSGSNDFAGQWQDISSFYRHSEMTLRLDNQYLHIGYPKADEYVDAPLSGAETVMSGPHAAVGMTYEIRWAGQRNLLIRCRHDGKPFNQVNLKLSDDGRVITNSWWESARPTDKDTLVYEKN